MTVFVQRGQESYRWDVAGVFDRPPNLAPPRWALVESLWHFLGRPRDQDPAGTDSIVVSPENWVEDLIAGLAPGSEGSSLCLVVPDHTRPGPWRLLLPALLERLADVSEFGERTLLIATGTHAAVSDSAAETCLAGLSPAARSAWSVRQNSDRDFSDHQPIGETASGTPVSLHPCYLEAGTRILFGEVSYHYFAGFGGGPKLVFPGLAEPRGAGRNHQRALIHCSGTADLNAGNTVVWNPQCAIGQLRDNPVHLDLLEAALLSPPNWVVTIVPRPDPNADPSLPSPPRVEIRQGAFPEAYLAATEQYDRDRRLEFTQLPDLLIVDAGGDPRDRTFLQAHKSLQSARAFVRKGGRVLLVAGCREGWGSSEFRARASGTPGVEGPTTEVPNSDQALHLQTWIAFQNVLSHCQVGLWSDLPAPEVATLGMVPLESETEARSWMGQNGRWGWLPRAERFRPGRGWLGGASGDPRAEGESAD